MSISKFHSRINKLQLKNQTELTGAIKYKTPTDARKSSIDKTLHDICVLPANVHEMLQSFVDTLEV